MRPEFLEAVHALADYVRFNRSCGADARMLARVLVRLGVPLHVQLERSHELTLPANHTAQAAKKRLERCAANLEPSRALFTVERAL